MHFSVSNSNGFDLQIYLFRIYLLDFISGKHLPVRLECLYLPSLGQNGSEGGVTLTENLTQQAVCQAA